ncbi:hypothetical protein [Heliophilum fasciatum]|uniref:Uncharacterized protein n=1 Tax=Heliophilum fasciatum TaxID=35700 RepID=A0A4R2RYI5_9FIRM|nr:hypothetical protein [Heliophilum fasciatum]MCW2276876.1 hypothetical protein [Heliophilum fasciatum]TCP68663.1 hypothetical protein EDD73_10259 [Heliophilum fasciatum]
MTKQEIDKWMDHATGLGIIVLGLVVMYSLVGALYAVIGTTVFGVVLWSLRRYVINLYEAEKGQTGEEA